MTDITQAAERLDAELRVQEQHGDTRTIIVEGRKVLDAYLAAQQEADELSKLVDAAWLEEKLGASRVPAKRGEVGWYKMVSSSELYVADYRSDYRVDNRTRAAVLGLLTWLPLPLKEQPQ